MNILFMLVGVLEESTKALSAGSVHVSLELLLTFIWSLSSYLNSEHEQDASTKIDFLGILPTLHLIVFSFPYDTQMFLNYHLHAEVFHDEALSKRVEM